MSSKSAPPPPNFTGAAQAQAQASQQNTQQQTQANRPDQSTPFGFSNWSQGPNGQWSQQAGLSGGLGAAAQGLEGQIAGMSQPMDWSQFGKVETGDQARDQAIQGAYGQATSRLNPQWDQRGQQLDAQLASQGLAPGSEAYERAKADFGRDRNDAYSSAMNGAIGQGTAAGSAAFQNNLMARQQQVVEALRGREQPLQELQGLQGFMQMPGFQGAGLAQSPQLLQAAMAQGNYGLQNQQMQNQFWADLMGGGSQLGSAAMFAFA